MREEGTSLIETAIAIPIVLFLVFAVFTFAFAGYNKVVVTSAARIGAREYAISGSVAKARQAAESELALAVIQLDSEISFQEESDSVNVFVSAKQAIFVPGLNAILSGRLSNQLTLLAEAKYKKEGW